MTLISEILGERRTTVLARPDFRRDFYSKAIPVTTTQERGSKTVDFNSIDFLYKEDAISFNTINRMVQSIMSAKNHFSSTKKSILTYFNLFFDRIGEIGQEVTKDKLYEYILKDLFMYGNSFVELVSDEKEELIMDLKMIDGKRMDYLRSSMGDIIVDKYSSPIGYTLKLPHGLSARGYGDEIPKQYLRNVNKLEDQMFLLSKRIAHFKINDFGDKFWGVGVLEPVIKAVKRKMAIEEAQTNSIYTRGTFPVIASVGDNTHETSEQELNSVLDTLRSMRHDRYFAFPSYVKVNALEVKQSDIADNTMLYLIQNQASAAGIPLPFVTGSGQATNRATLNNQQQMWEMTLEYYIKQMTDMFERLILKRISVTNGLSDYPKIVWGDVKAEEKNNKSKRLHLAISDGSILPQEVRPYILSSENIEPKNEEYNKSLEIQKNPKKVQDKKVPSFQEDQTKKEITTKKQ